MPEALRRAALPAVILAFFAAVAAGSVPVSAAMPLAALLPVAAVVLVAGGVLFAYAFVGAPAGVMAYFALLDFMTNAQFRVRAAGDIDSDWQSVLKFGLWAGAGVIGSVHLPSLRNLLQRPGCFLSLAYITVALLSSFYSPIPAYSFGCAFALLCLFSFSFSLTTVLTESQYLWTLALAMAAFYFVSWIVFYGYPELGTSPFWTLGGMYYRMCGIAGQATNLASTATKGLGAVFVLWWTRRCRLPSLLLLGGLAAATLVASDGRTAAIAAMMGLAAVVVSRSPWSMALSVLAVLVGLIVALVAPSSLAMLSSHFSRSGDPSEVYTLTGRLEIWDFVWRKIGESPWLGWGYNSSKAILASYYDFENGLMVDSAHNLYLQSLLSVGVLGTAPLVALLVYLCVQVLRHAHPLSAYLLVVILISSISDTGTIGTTPTVMTLLFLVMSVQSGVWEPAPGRDPRMRRASQPGAGLPALASFSTNAP